MARHRCTGDHVHPVPDPKVGNIDPDGGDDARCFETRTGRKCRFFQIGSPSEHRIRAVQGDRLDPQLNLIRLGGLRFFMFQPQHFGATKLMKADDTAKVKIRHDGSFRPWSALQKDRMP